MQLNLLFIFHVDLPNLMVLPSFMYGHALHCCPHFTRPFTTLIGLWFGGFGVFALIRNFLRSFCLLSRSTRVLINHFGRRKNQRPYVILMFFLMLLKGDNLNSLKCADNSTNTNALFNYTLPLHSSTTVLHGTLPLHCRSEFYYYPKKT